MAANEVNNRGVSFTIAAPIAANAGVGPKSGDPLVIGTGTSPGYGIACVAETSYTQPSGLVPTGNIDVKTEGVFSLPILPKTAKVGGSNHTFAPGDRVYADNDGTYDATTGVYYGFTLDAASVSGIHFGNILDVVTGGSTVVYARVRLKNAG